MAMSTGDSAVIKIRDEASAERARRAAALAPGSHVHLIGICGVGMTAAARLMRLLGFRVSGSDKAFYPPMGDEARRLADKIYEGYDIANLTERPDMVIVGNTIWRNNPEAVHAMEQGMLCVSMPELFEGVLIGSYENCGTSVVIAGTHGKTTTTAALATLLDVAGLAPGFFVGGLPLNLPGNIRPVSLSLPPEKRVAIMEGDEYDSAFFAKWPKFHSYRPDIVVMTSLEFDHADIYRSVDEIATEFERLAERVPAAGHILVWDGEPRLRDVMAAVSRRGALKAKLWSYGESADSAFRVVSREVKGQEQKLVFDLRGKQVSVDSQLTGPQNAQNYVAAAAVADLLDVPKSGISSGLHAFTGVARRQHTRADIDGVLVIEDFAHHPTAVRVTLQGLRESYPERRMIVTFEPRTNTSKRACFQQDYVSAFECADIAIIAQLTEAGGYSATGNLVVPLDTARLMDDLHARGKQAYAMKRIDEVRAKLLSLVQPGDLVVLMSNGDFQNLIPDFIADLQKRKAQNVQA